MYNVRSFQVFIFIASPEITPNKFRLRKFSPFHISQTRTFLHSNRRNACRFIDPTSILGTASSNSISFLNNFCRVLAGCWSESPPRLTRICILRDRCCCCWWLFFIMLWGCILPVADRISPLHLAGGSCCPPGIMLNPSAPTRSHAASPTKYSAPKGLSSRRSEHPVVYLEIYTQGFLSKGSVQSVTFSGFFTKLFPRKLQIQTIYPSTSAIFLNLDLFSQFLKTTFEPSGLPLTPKAPFPRPLSTLSAKIRCRPVLPVIFLFWARCVWNGKILCIWHSNIYISKSRLEIGHQSFKQEYLKTSRKNSLRPSLPAICAFYQPSTLARFRERDRNRHFHSQISAPVDWGITGKAGQGGVTNRREKVQTTRLTSVVPICHLLKF